MNILPSIYRQAVDFFEHSFLSTLTAQQKKIAACVAIIFTSLLVGYAFYSYRFKAKKIESDDLKIPSNSSLDKIADLMVGIEDPQEIPKIRQEAAQEYQQGIKTFSIEILQKKVAESKTDNQLISPLGISFLLSMLKHGVGAEDQAEIERIIHLPKDSDELKVSAFQLIKKLQENGLNVAGLLYLNGKYRLNNDYQTQTSQYYQSQVASGDSAQAVNTWVQSMTNGQIQEIVTDDDLTDFFVVLANAMHFKADWKKKFDIRDTDQEVPFVAPTRTVKVDMMRKTSRVDYFEDDHCQAIRLPYLKGECAMLLVLPKKDNDFSFVDTSWFDALSKGMNKTIRMQIALPRFKLEQEVDVKGMLKEMKMEHLFVQPDFTPLVDLNHPASKAALPDLHISKMTQKSTLACDEEGTEASTVTALVARRESATVSSKTITFDRPFLAALMMKEVPILFGVIRDPSV